MRQERRREVVVFRFIDHNMIALIQHVYFNGRENMKQKRSCIIITSDGRLEDPLSPPLTIINSLEITCIMKPHAATSSDVMMRREEGDGMQER